MKKIIALILTLFVLGLNVQVIAQDSNENEVVKTEDSAKSAIDTSVKDATIVDAKNDSDEETTEEESAGATAIIKKYFIQGGPGFMALPLICLILGLAIGIERIISLAMMSTNTKKFTNSVEDALQKGDIEEAKEISRSTKGPIASIFYQGLDRKDDGIDVVEKSVSSYGNVQVGNLEKGLTWLSLFIALAPMLGFLGTVIGMISAFDAIEEQGDISPTVVAGGIKVALLTTVAGLIVAIILQVVYNAIVSKIDSMVNEMEDSSVSLIDMLLKYKVVEK